MERKDTNITEEKLEKELEYSTSLMNKLIEAGLSNNRLLEALKQRNSIIKKQRKELKNLNREYKHMYKLQAEYFSENFRLGRELYAIKRFSNLNLFLLVMSLTYILTTLFTK